MTHSVHVTKADSGGWLVTSPALPGRVMPFAQLGQIPWTMRQAISSEAHIPASEVDIRCVGATSHSVGGFTVSVPVLGEFHSCRYHRDGLDVDLTVCFDALDRLP